ncbi:hypothetical protein [Flagellimonas crocea]|uniref:hypothetical protein n=1 Tax=Flagellimonas crocea TaxID=3067311 RepID=UPI00296F767B|nr:hypothetical protein [Muricauda sp. DH64]
MKTNFKLLLTSLFVLLIFNACNKTFEEQLLLEESQLNEIITVKGQFDEFHELKKLYDDVVVKEIKKNTADKKGEYNFQIDSTNVIKKSFENDNYYTFSVIREDDIWPNFENLVISNKDGQDPEAYLFVYIPDEAYLESFKENPNTAFSGSIEAKPLDYEKLMASAGGCINYTTEICNYGGHTDNGLGEGVAGPGCQDTYIVNNTVCFISPNPFDGVGGGGGSSDGGSGGGGGSSNDSDLPLADSDVITKIVVTHEQLHQLNSDLGFVYASPEAYWVRDSKNKYEVSRVIEFVEANKINGIVSKNVKDFSAWYIKLKMLPNSPCGVGHDCVKSIKMMAQGLRTLHGQEGILMADYFDSLVSDYGTFTKSDLQAFYTMAKAITEDYNNRMFDAVTGGFVAGITPVLEIALFEVGAPVAIKLLQKIPISWVYRGTRLNNMVKKVRLLGKMGNNNTVREVVTNTPVAKASELFKALTKHAISKTNKADGVILANMGNGNFITYRPITASSSNIPATITLDFRAAGIWSKVRDVKFVLP